MTFWTFLLMIAAVCRRALSSSASRTQPGAFWGFFAMFMLLFFATGVGNASTFQMIPVIMRKEIDRLMPQLRRRRSASASADKESAAIIGFTSAIAAYGAFFIPKSYGTSIAHDRRPGGGAVGLPDLLRDLLARDLVVLHAPGGLLYDIEREPHAPIAAARGT